MNGPLLEFMRKQRQDIEDDDVLIRFGQALILVHFFTALFWLNQDFQSIVLDVNQSVCWPFFSACDAVKSRLAPIAGLLLPTYFVLSAGLFCLSLKFHKKIWIFLFSLELLKLGFSSLDYRFMGNYHFIPHIITLYYLFFAQKRAWAKFWIFTFYLGAASLKLNWEWLSGASLSWKVPGDNPQLLPFLAVAGLWAEVAGAQLLYFKKKVFRVAGLLLLLMFHAASYLWVGFFYPCIMLCILSLIAWEVTGPATTPSFDFKDRNLILPGFLWAAFVVSQTMAFTDARISALDGMKRLASLNMFDARSACKGLFIIQDKERFTEIPFQNKDIPVRNKCDNIIFLAQAKKICFDSATTPRRVDAFLVSRRTSDSDFIDIVREQDLCSKLKR